MKTWSKIAGGMVLCAAVISWLGGCACYVAPAPAGVAASGMILFNPMDPSKQILNLSTSNDQPDQDQWERLQISFAPKGAKVAILNIYGHIRGFPGAAPEGDERHLPRVTFSARRAGSTTEPENYTFAAYGTNDAAYNVQQNTVYVPLDDNGAIEFKYQLWKSNNSQSSAHLRVYVQGFVMSDAAKR